MGRKRSHIPVNTAAPRRRPPRSLPSASLALLRGNATRRAHRDFRGEFKELLAVAPSQIGNGEYPSFLPQEVVGEGGNVTHVDTGADHGPTRSSGSQSYRNQSTHWCEDNGQIQLCGWSLGGSPGPFGAKLEGKRNRVFITLPHERKYLAALVTRYLRDNVSRRPEAIEPDVFAAPAIRSER